MVIESIGNTNFIDGSSKARNLRMISPQVASASISPIYYSMTVGEAVASVQLNNADQRSITYAITEGNGVILMPAFYTLSEPEKQTTLVHEMLHRVSGLRDVALARRLKIEGITDRSSMSEASAAISSFLRNGCGR
jgi:hypothetical protein